ncbi:MAG TPA: hypothetical protein VN610_02885 [Bryobacteraceae bacterium]|nr:hypothetical protein [Bryobacteraceae bacterium]
MAVEPGQAVDQAPHPEEKKPASWMQKFGSVLLILFSFEIGIFLLVFPWLQAWEVNSFAITSPWVHTIWINPYFRGALSGLGAVNLYISLAEIGRLRRFASPE